MTEDGEAWTTSTERENDVFSQYLESGLAATKYVIMVDRDNAGFPHLLQGQGNSRIDITSMYLALDAAVNTDGIINMGVISRIDAINADMWYVLGVPFLATTNQFILSLRGVPSQVKLDLGGTDGATLLHGVTNNRETNVAAVNTDTLLDSPIGPASVFPEVGDIIMKIGYTSGGALNVGAFLFYHGH
jgi:hypothetical protein